MNDRLYRSRDDRIIAGVAGGLAERLGVDPAIVRVVWALLALFTGGILLLVYILMAIVVPEAPEGTSAATSPIPRSTAQAARPARRAGGGSLVLGLILVLVGGYLLLRELIPVAELDRWWPVALIAVGVVLLTGAFVPDRGPD